MMVDLSHPYKGATVATTGGRGRGNFDLDGIPPARLAELDAKYPPAGRATIKDFVNYIDCAVKLIGIDHVRISSGFDGGKQ
jgi:membrane dipeptidase